MTATSRRWSVLHEHGRTCTRPDAYWSDGILAGPANKRNRGWLALLLRHGARVPKVSKWGPYYYFKHYDMGRICSSRAWTRTT